MKKIIISENQAQKLMSKILDEQVPAARALEYSMNDGRYHMKCEFYFEHDDNQYLVYKGGEIWDMELGYGDVSFMIEIDHQTFGIKGLKIRDVKGPKEVKTQIRFLPPGAKYSDDDSFDKIITENVIIPLNWRNIKIENDGARYHDMDYYGVFKQIDTKVEPDGKGGLEGGRMTIIVNESEKYND